MSDVDDELLALAGGDASSDEEEQHQRRLSSPDDDNDNDEPMNISRSASGSRDGTPEKRKGDASASRGGSSKKAAPKKTKRRDLEESEEEGEASSAPGSPASLESAPMDESDSDSDGGGAPRKGRGTAGDDDDDDENKYPVDGLFMSLEEREEIMNMREVEREQILAERAQEKDRIHQNKLLRQLVSNDEQRKKRSASIADLDEGQRKTSRVRTKVGSTRAGEAPSAMDTLKNRRAEKNERNRRREEDRERQKDRSSPISGHGHDDDDGDDSEVEWAKTTRKSRSPEAKALQVVELRDIERVRLSRSRFGQVCFYPGFSNAMTGTFVRISIGPDPETREPVYRMAVVKGFTKGKPYAISGPQGQPIVTDQYLLAAHGKAQREWPFLACSDSPFTESEWSRYQKVCHVDSVSVPKKGTLLNKADDINKLLNRSWTEDELTDKVQRQQALKNRFNGVERMKLEYGIKEAKAQGDTLRAEQLQAELEHLETPRLAFKTSLTQVGQANSDQGSGGLSQQERLARLNAENRRRNAEAVRKAQLKERAKVRAIERKIERGEEVEEDHSRRLRTRAKFVHDINDQGPDKKGSQPASQAASGTTTPANGTPQLGAKSISGTLPHLAKLQQRTPIKSGLPTIHRPIGDDDIIASLDLDIDESILDD